MRSIAVRIILLNGEVMLQHRHREDLTGASTGSKVKVNGGGYYRSGFTINSNNGLVTVGTLGVTSLLTAGAVTTPTVTVNTQFNLYNLDWSTSGSVAKSDQCNKSQEVRHSHCRRSHQMQLHIAFRISVQVQQLSQQMVFQQT